MLLSLPLNLSFFKRNYIRLFSLAIVFNLTTVLYAQAPYGTAGEQTAVRLDEAVDSPPFGYYEYLPEDFDLVSGRRYPLVLFYHGIGEKGNGSEDLQRVLLHGPPKLINQGRHFPVIVISPQSSSGWFNGDSFLRLYTYLTTHYPIDINRVYVTGLSAGGGGVWKSLEAHYDKIAAAVPICGANIIGDPSDFLQNTNIWAHHNFEDTRVGKGNTINNVNRIANIGVSVMSVYPYGNGSNTVADDDYTMHFDTVSDQWYLSSGVIKPDYNLSFTLYKFGGHDAWTKTYNNQDVWDWMFSKDLNTLSTASFNISTDKVSIYPNPSKEETNLNLGKNTFNISIADRMGRIVDMYNNKKDHLSIDVSSYSTGLYYVSITNLDNSNSQTLKLVIQ